MISVTRLDGSELVINSDLIESLEHTPDTVISLLNGRKLVVREKVSEVIDRVVVFRQRVLGSDIPASNAGAATCSTHWVSDRARGVVK